MLVFFVILKGHVDWYPKGHVVQSRPEQMRQASDKLESYISHYTMCRLLLYISTSVCHLTLHYQYLLVSNFTLTCYLTLHYQYLLVSNFTLTCYLTLHYQYLLVSNFTLTCYLSLLSNFTNTCSLCLLSNFQWVIHVCLPSHMGKYLSNRIEDCLTSYSTNHSLASAAPHSIHYGYVPVTIHYG